MEKQQQTTPKFQVVNVLRGLGQATPLTEAMLSLRSDRLEAKIVEYTKGDILPVGKDAQVGILLSGSVFFMHENPLSGKRRMAWLATPARAMGLAAALGRDEAGCWQAAENGRVLLVSSRALAAELKVVRRLGFAVAEELSEQQAEMSRAQGACSIGTARERVEGLVHYVGSKALKSRLQQQEIAQLLGISSKSVQRAGFSSYMAGPRVSSERAAARA